MADGREDGAAVMARKPMTLAELRASRPFVDRGKVTATTEDDIRRHRIEDDEDPDAPVPPFGPVPSMHVIRPNYK